MLKTLMITMAASVLMLGAGTSFADHRLSERALVAGAIGGGAGAYIGAELGGRDGAMLGAALGGLAATGIATERHRHVRHGKKHRSVRVRRHVSPHYRHGVPRLRVQSRKAHPHRHGHRYRSHRHSHRYKKAPRLGPPYCPPGLRRQGRC